MTDDEPSGPKNRPWLESLANVFSSAPKSRKDFTDLLNSARENNIIDHDALGIIEGALNVCDKQVREIMIPRSQMAVIPQHLELNETLKLVIENRHSRYPVLDETADHIVGILLAKELLPLLLERQDGFNIKNIIRPAAIVPESKRLYVLLKEFREQRYHMAIVVDEYGGIAGLITIEDILEEIVGEIQDEKDDAEQEMIIPRNEAGYFIQALTPIEDFNEYFNVNMNADELDTIGGVIVQAFGRMPKVGENIDIDIFKFRISEGNDRQVKLLEMQVVPKNITT
ncbi:MAG: magnesium and cobalt transporter [Porticoccus sp.]|jgi:magnesium and cobalt transporter